MSSISSVFLDWLADSIKINPSKECLEEGLPILTRVFNDYMTESLLPTLMIGGDYPFRPTIDILVKAHQECCLTATMGSRLPPSSEVSAFQIGLYTYVLLNCHEQPWKKFIRHDAPGNAISEPIDGSDRWESIAHLGFGAFGLVRAYKRKGTDRCIAAKRIYTNHGIVKAAAERETMTKLRHDHVVDYLGSYFNEDEGQFWIYSEYISGGTLDRLAMSVVLEERDIKVLARQVIEGLAYLHDNKIIHRGLKGSNLLITLDGCVKIGDLGCATVLDINRSLSRPGTASFASPELLLGEQYDERTDIWSFGMVIVELFMKGHPWRRRTAGWIAVQLQSHLITATIDDLTGQIQGVSVKEMLLGILSVKSRRPEARGLMSTEWFFV